MLAITLSLAIAPVLMNAGPATSLPVQGQKNVLPTLRMRGTDMVDPSGKKVVLKGANLGNWHVIEFWMLCLSGEKGVPADQFRLEELLTKRFGEAEKERLMEVYRSSWITERDFKNLQQYKFNLLRLPTNYRLMEDDRKPFQLKPNAFKWIDRAVDLAEKHGMYVILDMHGAQGGQSPYDHTGHSDQNKLKDSPEAQKRLAWLWGELAKRYRNRSAVVAYDVFNEPYGTPKPIQVSVFEMAYREIRKHDKEKLIFAHGNYDDFSHYGDPKEKGWKNVGFQMHYYPGLFGNGSPNLKTHLRHLASLEGVAARVKKLNVPFLVGEMNVVFDLAGGADMMRATYDLHEKFGWMTTMWSYKALSKEGGFGNASWGAVTNIEPAKMINFETASKNEVEAYFKSFATQKLAIKEPLRNALANPKYKVKPFDLPPLRKTAPQESLAGWKATDIGGALKGGLKNNADGSFALFGGGSDIWGGRDEFRFLHQTLDGDGSIEVTINAVEAVDGYTKAGVMLRAGLGDNDPFLLVSIFPSGEAQVAKREAKGGEAGGAETRQLTLPGLRLKIERRAGQLTVFTAKPGEKWEQLSTMKDFLPSRVQAGAVALSHSSPELVEIVYRDLKLSKN